VLETSARLLHLLSLLQSRREWAGGDLADRLEVGARTVRRDVDRLRRLGYPIAATPGVAGGYRLGAGASLPPLLLDEEEAVAVAVGLRAAANAGVSGFEETSVRALAKLEQVLPARLRRRVNAVRSVTVPYAFSGPSVNPDTLAVIAIACRDHERLRFAYRGRVYDSAPKLRPLFAYFAARELRRIGVAAPRTPIVAYAASAGCDLRGLQWQRVAVLSR